MLQTAMIASCGARAIEEAKQTLGQIGGAVSVPAEVARVADDLIQIFVVSNRATGVLVIVVVLAITAHMIVKGGKEYRKSFVTKM